MTRPRLLDLCCCAGGASMGYYLAGFAPVGIDIAPQPHYPFTFIQADALEYLNTYGHTYAAITAGPPCQAYSKCQRIRNNRHPDLISSLRSTMRSIGLPWVIENVEGAPLIDPIMLCGASFPALRTYRHRYFEASIKIPALPHMEHRLPLQKMGRPPKPGHYMHVIGNFSGVQQAREAMGISWMPRDKLREAIPPAYTEYIGHHLMQVLTGGSTP